VLVDGLGSYLLDGGEQLHGQLVVDVEQRRHVPRGDHDDVVGAEAR
jgi:hypothetical protein